MIIDAPSIPTIIGVITFLLVLDVVAVALRLYARRGLKQKLRADDWLMVPIIIGIFGCAACLFHGKSNPPNDFQTSVNEPRYSKRLNGLSVPAPNGRGCNG